jgi:hypothetical protein
MLEIENEQFENERRVKNQRISVLENRASTLNEKLLILRMEFDEKETKGQETEGRLKEQLKDLSEELLVLKKKRNEIFIETLEHESQIRRNSLKEHHIKRRNSKLVQNKDGEKIILNGKRTLQKEVNSEVSINVIKVKENKEENNSSPNSESSIGKKNETLKVNRVGFGSTEKFEDKIDSYNKKIYHKNVKKLVGYTLLKWL